MQAAGPNLFKEDRTTARPQKSMNNKLTTETEAEKKKERKKKNQIKEKSPTKINFSNHQENSPLLDTQLN